VGGGGSRLSGGCGLEGAQPLGSATCKLHRRGKPGTRGSPCQPTWSVAGIQF
jgi:hypothetical protein